MKKQNIVKRYTIIYKIIDYYILLLLLIVVIICIIDRMFRCLISTSRLSLA